MDETGELMTAVLLRVYKFSTRFFTENCDVTFKR